MPIIFNNNMYIYLISYGIIPLLVIYGICYNKQHHNVNTNDNYLSKQTTNAMRGLCILIIMLHHTTIDMAYKGYMKPFLEVGYLSVSIFLFLSGYALMISFLHKKDYLRGFITKRIGRIYLPFLIVNIIYIVLYNVLLKTHYGLKNVLYTSLTVQFIDYVLWYVKITIFFYVVFYVSLKLFNKKNIFRTLIISSILYIIACRYVFKLDTYWYNTVFCFPIGTGFALYKDKINSFFKKYYLQTMLITVLGFGITFIIYHKNILLGTMFNIASSIFFTLFVATFVYKINIYSKVLAFVGKIAFEMYLIHLILLQIYFKTTSIKGSYNMFIFYALTIISAYILKTACDFKFRRKTATKIKSKIIAD